MSFGRLVIVKIRIAETGCTNAYDEHTDYLVCKVGGFRGGASGLAGDERQGHISRLKRNRC